MADSTSRSSCTWLGGWPPSPCPGWLWLASEVAKSRSAKSSAALKSGETRRSRARPADVCEQQGRIYIRPERNMAYLLCYWVGDAPFLCGASAQPSLLHAPVPLSPGRGASARCGATDHHFPLHLQTTVQRAAWRLSAAPSAPDSGSCFERCGLGRPLARRPSLWTHCRE